MLSWIERVVPQPPPPSPTPVVVEKAAKSESEPKRKVSRRSRKKASSKSAVVSEIKEGAGTATPDPVSTPESSGRGVLTWLSEGLGKVVPQPLQPGAVPQQDTKTSDPANPAKETEAQKVDADGKKGDCCEDKMEERKAMPEDTVGTPQGMKAEEKTDPSGAEAKPQPSSDTSAPGTTGTKTIINRMLEEFEKMIPQPESVKKSVTSEKQAADQAPQKESTPSKPLVKHRASSDSLSFFLFPQSLVGEGGSMFKKIIQGLEKAIPQPVSKQKPEEPQTAEAGGSNPGQEISGSKGA